MRHVIFALVVALYVIVIGQNWGHYSAALMTAAWVRASGNLRAEL